MTPTTSSLVFIPAGSRRRSRIATLAIASAVIILAGCGGGSDQFTATNVSATMTNVIRENLGSDWTMQPLECVKDGDQYHWKCIAPVRHDGKLLQFSTNITCDGDTGKCLSEPQGVVP